MSGVVVTQADREAGATADDGAIAVARALSARDCGALQSEMREARKAYLAEAFARHRAAGQAELAWQPIETAPHGVSVLVVEAARPNHPYLWKGRYQDVHQATFEDGAWLAPNLDKIENKFFRVTHWRPMPAPPPHSAALSRLTGEGVDRG